MAAAIEPNAFWQEPADLPFDVAVLEQRQDSNICWQAMVYTSELYRDQPMRIFAWYAWPKAAGRHPAVLSIHGGGGGADLPRAQDFARRGYACLAYDWNAWRQGNPAWKSGEPLPATTNTVYCGLWYDDWGKHFLCPGPDGDWKWPTLYRSIMAARRGLTWLEQQPQVEAGALFAEGHSWGGFTVQLLAGLDPRLKGVVSSAAAGAWASRYRAGQEGHIRDLKPDQAEACLQRYDPASFADRMRAPILVRLATADFFGSVDNLMEYWDRIAAPKALELQPSGNHTFWDVGTRAAWFDRCRGAGPDFPRVNSVTLAPARRGGWTVEAAGSGPVPIAKALVAWTTSTNAVWNRRGWAHQPLAPKTDGKWSGSFSPVATGGPLRYFVSMQDERGHVGSSLPVVRDLPAAQAAPAVVRQADMTTVRAQRPPLTAPREWRRARPAGPVANGPELAGLQSVELRTLWDTEAIYVQARIADTTPWTPAMAGDADFCGIRLAAIPATNAAATAAGAVRVRWHPQAGGGARADVFAGPRGETRVTNVAALVATVDVETGRGVTLSAAVPWSLFGAGFTPAAGQTFDFRASAGFGDYLTRERVSEIEFNRPDPENKTWRQPVMALE